MLVKFFENKKGSQIGYLSYKVRIYVLKTL